MAIGIFKGADVTTGKPVAFFDRDNAAVLEELFSLADVAAEADLTADITKVDAGLIRRVAQVSVESVDDPALYDLKIEAIDHETEADVEKVTDAGRAPSQPPGAAIIQALSFSKARFTPEQARAWIQSHDGFGDYGMEETAGSFVFSQYDPKYFDRFKTSKLGFGILAIFGIVSGAETEPDDNIEAETTKAIEGARVSVAVRELNKAIDRRGLRFLADTADVRKSEDGTEERFVMSLVLEPNDGADGSAMKPDTQDDVYSADEIRKTAHGWMENHGHVDLQHNWQALGKDEVAVLESFVAPTEFELNGNKIFKGTWMLGLRIKNDDLWTAVKAGEIGAYSVGGTARRKPLSGEQEAEQEGQS